MAVSKTDICNMALITIGANTVTNPLDATESVAAEACDKWYDIVRDACLEDVNWSFAITRFDLTTYIPTAPDFGFNYAYNLPSTVLRVIEVNGNEYDWVLEDRQILTDLTALEIVAVQKVDDPNKFSPSFIQYFANRLAGQLALVLNSSAAMQTQLFQLALGLKKVAQGNDGRQGKAKVKKMTQKWSR